MSFEILKQIVGKVLNERSNRISNEEEAIVIKLSCFLKKIIFLNLFSKMHGDVNLLDIRVKSVKSYSLTVAGIIWSQDQLVSTYIPDTNPNAQTSEKRVSADPADINKLKSKKVEKF